jgi:hypothetical protein
MVDWIALIAAIVRAGAGRGVACAWLGAPRKLSSFRAARCSGSRRVDERRYRPRAKNERISSNTGMISSRPTHILRQSTSLPANGRSGLVMPVERPAFA